MSKKQKPIITDSGVVLRNYLDLTVPLDLDSLTPEQREWLLDDSLTDGLFIEDEDNN